MTKEVKLWLEKADEDRLAAEWLLQKNALVTTPAVFHIPQAVEKLLKAYLTSKGIRFERKQSYLL